MGNWLRWHWEEVAVCGCVVALVVVLGVLVVVASESDRRAWQAFKAAHHCKVVAEMPGDWVTGIGTTGKGATVVTTSRTPDKEGWLCDDGITHWRDKP